MSQIEAKFPGVEATAGADPKTGQFVFIIADEEKRSLAF